MIELKDNQLVVSFPEVHDEASIRIDFQRTLRIPDDNREYPLPPGLGRFPLLHTEDFAQTIPKEWTRRGGVMLPMYQSEALWLNFNRWGREYPCAVKVAAGKINAVSGEQWHNALHDDPQDNVVVPEQPWLDGFNVAKGRIRQFVAMPLGDGYSAEEQITGKAEVGGLQIIVYPMKAKAYEAWKARESATLREPAFDLCMQIAPDLESKLAMGLSPGGLMRQEIYDDPHGIEVWDTENYSRCFVHLVNSEQYATITGHAPPHAPPGAEQYTQAGLPWFDYYGADLDALEGSGVLSKLDSVEAKRLKNGLAPSADNSPVKPKRVIEIKADERPVKEGEF